MIARLIVGERGGVLFPMTQGKRPGGSIWITMRQLATSTITDQIQISSM